MQKLITKAHFHSATTTKGNLTTLSHMKIKHFALQNERLNGLEITILLLEWKPYISPCNKH